MGVTYNTSIVTNGLVLCLDAGNTKSYPGSGTAWTDLSGSSNNGTLINTPTYQTGNGGVLYFDGTNERSEITDSNTIDFPGDFTVEVWFNSETTDATVPRGLVNHRVSNNVGTGTWSIGLRSTNIIFEKQQSTVVTTAWGSFALNTWYQVVVSRSGTNIKGWLNGVEGMSITDSTDYTNANIAVIGMWGTFTAGWIGTPSGPFQGKIPVVRMYKGKAFTATDVQQNFNALRGRFGI